jgi:hypothetical protein
MKQKTGPVSELLAHVRKKARLNDMAVVGPLVWYPAHEIGHAGYDDYWATFVSASHDTPKGPAWHCDQATLGKVAGEIPEALLDAVACAWIVTSGDELTRKQAEGRRQEIIRGLEKDFASVRAFDDDVECVRFCAERWPGAKINKLARNIAAHYAHRAA